MLPPTPFSSRLRPAAIAFVALLWSSLIVFQAAASSPPSRPLKQISRPSIHSLEIVPRNAALQRRSHPGVKRSLPSDSALLQHTDSFRLTLSAFGKKHYLHLQPNEDLLHRSASVKYYRKGSDGREVLDRVEPLLPHSILAYSGDVVHEEASDTRLKEDTVGGFADSKARKLGWARIVVHSQGDVEAGKPPVIEGAFTVNGEVYHVMPKDKYLRLKHPEDPHPDANVENDSPLVIFRDSDIFHPEPAVSSLNRPSCAHDHLEWNTDPWINPSLRHSLISPAWDISSSLTRKFLSWSKRDDVAGGNIDNNFVSHIGQSAGCPIDQRIVYMGAAADCKYVQQHGGPSNATQAILNNWNSATALYKQTFNISLGILEVQVRDSDCPTTPDPATPWNVDCSNSVTLNDRLSLFSQWRGAKGDDGTGLWHLMSGCPTGTEIGVAWLGTLCMTSANGQSTDGFVSGTGVSTAGRSEWQVVAHEIGHNFGAIHDCTSGCNGTSNCCPLSADTCDSNGQFIMNPTSSAGETNFSPCSLGNICSLMQSQTNTTCIQPPDPTKQTLALQMCGNGIVEPGEDCDPGQGITSPCCDSATCKFNTGSVCDPASSPCCTQQCQFAPSSQVCRPARDVACDMEETCTGISAACPEDKTQGDGTSCGPGGLACASGQCTSLSQQCATVGGSMGLTKGCPTKGDTSCQLVCQSPSNNQQCVILQAQLIDGSSCGYGGRCRTGQCQSGSILDTFRAWYRQNLQIAIPATIGVGIVVLLILGGITRCIIRCCTRRRQAKLQPLSSYPNTPSFPATPQPAFQNAPERIWNPPPRRTSNQLSSNRDSRPYRTSGRSEDGVYIPPPSRHGTRRNRTAASRSVQPPPPAAPTGRMGSLLAGIAAWRRTHPEQPASPPTQDMRERGSRPARTERRERSSRRSERSGYPDRSNWVDPTAYNGDLRGPSGVGYNGYGYGY